MKNLTKSVIAAMALTVSTVALSVPGADNITPPIYLGDEETKEFHYLVHKTIRKMNSQLPRSIDSSTDLESTQFTNGWMVGVHTIDTEKLAEVFEIKEKSFNSKRVMDYFQDVMYDIGHNEICYQPDKLEIMGNYNMGYERTYYRRDNNRFMMRVQVSYKSCTNFFHVHGQIEV